MNKQTKGILFIIIPPIILIAVNIFYVIISVILSSMYAEIEPTGGQGFVNADTVVESSSSLDIVINIMNVVLGLIGLLAVLGIFIGVPLGIYFIVKHAEDGKKAKQGSDQQPQQNQSSPPQQPKIPTQPKS